MPFRPSLPQFLHSASLCVLTLAFLKVGIAQPIDKYYTSAMQENGVLYFIQPKEAFRNGEAHCSLTYDLTHLTSTDSVTLNFTFEGEDVWSIDSMGFHGSDLRLASGAEKFFIEADGKRWTHRYSTAFHFAELDALYRQKEPAVVWIKDDQRDVALRMKGRKWTKEASILSKVMAMIQVNK